MASVLNDNDEVDGHFYTTEAAWFQAGWKARGKSSVLIKLLKARRLCSQEECPHWRHSTKYPRKCFYEAQCWRGKLDILIAIIWKRFSR